MLEFFLPYVIGAALGIAPEGGEAASPDVAVSAEARAPEDQTPTGQFTTAGEIKPIIGMTKGSWVAVRNYNGQDLLYFTHLMAWRCGMWEVRYGINGAAATEIMALEPCHSDTNAPNALADVENFLPYIVLPENSVESVVVAITFDDGTTDTATFERSAIQMP